MDVPQIFSPVFLRLAFMFNFQKRRFSMSNFISLQEMPAPVWRDWVSCVRCEAEKHPNMDNMALSHHLILSVARELSKTNSIMAAQTLVHLMNEVVKFRNDNWQYSPDGRGPCSAVRGAFNHYVNNGRENDADLIAASFSRINGKLAWRKNNSFSSLPPLDRAPDCERKLDEVEQRP